MTLDQLLTQRKITKKQYAAALGAKRVWLAKFDNNLWIETQTGTKKLITRRGTIAYDGKTLTGN